MLFAVGLILCSSCIFAANARAAGGTVSAVFYETGGYFLQSRSETRMFDISKKVWCTSQPLPTAVGNHNAVTYNNVAVIIGGYHGNDNSGNKTDEVHSYDPAKNEFGDLPKLGRPRANFNSAVLGGKIYALGGKYDDEDPGTVEIYDGQKWELGPSLIKMQYMAAAAADIENGQIWAIGGLSSFDPPRNATLTEYLDTTKNEWQLGPSLLVSRMTGHKAVALGHDIYVCGGDKDDGTGTSSQKECEKLTGSKGEWVKVADMNHPRYDHGLIAYNGKLYAVGGFQGTEGDPAPVPSIEEYDPSTDKWSVYAEWTPEENSPFKTQIVLLTDVPESSLKCA